MVNNCAGLCTFLVEDGVPIMMFAVQRGAAEKSTDGPIRNSLPSVNLTVTRVLFTGSTVYRS